MKKQEVSINDITKEQFDRYLRLRDTGFYMLDIYRCADLICEPIEVYMTIAYNFSELYNKFYNW